VEVFDRLNLIGSTLADKYRVERVLGEGGGGIVYQGTNTLLGEQVAIKCIKPADGPRSKKAAADFTKEAKLLFNLAHPNIVRMYDIGLLPEDRGGLPYVVLEFLNGVPLDQDIARRKKENRQYSADEVFHLMREILAPMVFAHQRGVVHRDLKPSNIMLLDDGKRVKVLDFGTARTGEQVTRLTTAFTPRYAAPEQWDPSRGERGPWTDVFALGLVLYELGTLVQAVQGDDMPSILASVLGATRPAFGAKRIDLSALEPTLASAVALEPGARYRNAAEFLESIERASKAPKPKIINNTGTLPLSGSPQARALFLESVRGTMPMSPGMMGGMMGGMTGQAGAGTPQARGMQAQAPGSGQSRPPGYGSNAPPMPNFATSQPVPVTPRVGASPAIIVLCVLGLVAFGGCASCGVGFMACSKKVTAAPSVEGAP
jgi:serine/threonine protein kinase